MPDARGHLVHGRAILLALQGDKLVTCIDLAEVGCKRGSGRVTDHCTGKD